MISCLLTPTSCRKLTARSSHKRTPVEGPAEGQIDRGVADRVVARLILKRALDGERRVRLCRQPRDLAAHRDGHLLHQGERLLVERLEVVDLGLWIGDIVRLDEIRRIDAQADDLTGWSPGA